MKIESRAGRVPVRARWSTSDLVDHDARLPWSGNAAQIGQCHGGGVHRERPGLETDNAVGGDAARLLRPRHRGSHLRAVDAILLPGASRIRTDERLHRVHRFGLGS